MSHPKNSAFSVSAIAYPLAKWRYFLLFQSWSQLQSYLVILLCCTLAIQGLAYASKARIMPIGLLLAGMAVGGLAAVMAALRAQFTVTPASEDAVRRLVTEVECARYVEQGAQGNAIIYRQNLPRWLRWNESNIAVARDGDRLVVSGPVAALKRIRAHLLA
ncbi:MAG: hypothetical protein V4484_07045 [Pseudomonadota bacterium]